MVGRFNHQTFKADILGLFLGFAAVAMIGWGISMNNSLDGRVLGVGPGYGYGPGYTLTEPTQGDVTISAIVQGCYVQIHVYPEKRIPASGNWTLDIIVDIYNTSNVRLGTIVTLTDDQGYSPYLDLCAELGGPPPIGGYVLRVRGLSHLRQRFPAIYGAFTTVSTLFDLVGVEHDLLAGETSIVFDNFINGLDLSTQVLNLYSGDLKNDLNRDGQVNSLDLSITIFNLYTFGED